MYIVEIYIPQQSLHYRSKYYTGRFTSKCALLKPTLHLKLQNAVRITETHISPDDAHYRCALDVKFYNTAHITEASDTQEEAHYSIPAIVNINIVKDVIKFFLHFFTTFNIMW